MLIDNFYIQGFHDGENGTTLFLKPGAITEYKVRLDNGKDTFRVFTKDFPVEVLKRRTYIRLTLNDVPSNSGFYSIRYIGELPNKYTFANADNFNKENPLVRAGIDDILYNLDGKSEQILFDFVKTGNKELLKENIVYQGKIITLDHLRNIRKKDITKYIKDFKRVQQIYQFLLELEKLNITDEEIKFNIFLRFKNKDLKEVIFNLRNNPYILVTQGGMSLKFIDMVALSSGIKATDLRRVNCILEYNMQSIAESEGKTWVTISQYLGMEDFYPLDTVNMVFNEEKLCNLIKQLHETEDNTNIWFDGNNRIASRKYYQMEHELFEVIDKLTYQQYPAFNEVDVNRAIAKCEKKNGFKYTNEQKKAAHTLLRSNLSILMGYAGTGKSTVAEVITTIFKNKDILATALSGKATLRIQETTGIQNAKTMHSSLAQLKKKYFPYDLILIDEASMLGLELTLEFFKKIAPGTMVVIVGDNNQLAPLGSGNVFFDLLHADKINKAVITEVHRQKEGGKILDFATKARLMEPLNDDVKDIEEQDFNLLLRNSERDILMEVENNFMKLIYRYTIDDTMIVCPYKKGRPISVYNINNMIQQRLINDGLISLSKYIELNMEGEEDFPYKIYQGDRVINTTNKYKMTALDGSEVGIMNGALGTLKEIKEVKNKLGKIIKRTYLINFDGIGIVPFTSYDMQDVWLGYSITVHKSQGSQALGVIYPHQQGRLNNSEMIYTAVTRARKYCCVVGPLAALNKGITTKETNTKQTLLGEFITNELRENSVSGGPFTIDSNGNKPLEGQMDISNFIDATYEEVTSNLPLGAAARLSEQSQEEVAVDSVGKQDSETTEKSKANGPTTTIDAKKRARYDRNNAQRRKKWLNENGLKAREQSKLDKINVVKKYVETHPNCSQKDVVAATGFSKATVSRCWKEL